MSPTRYAVTALCTAALALGGCQKAENKSAKERLSKPQPPDPLIAKAEEVLQAQDLPNDPKLKDRVNRMRFAEARRRLGSFRLKTRGDLQFKRSGLNVDSAEDIEIVQSADGDFSVSLVTKGGSGQQLVYANGVLFLKNNNGRWRASRDPVGERNRLREDSAGIWRSFYDLYEHALTFQPRGETSYEGRTALKFGLSVKDLSQEARQLGRGEKPRPRLKGFDAGVPDAGPGTGPLVSEDEMKEWVSNRTRTWRKKARAAGGSGEMLVDKATGVILKVRFEGDLVVGDAKVPAELHVKLAHDVSDVGADLQVVVPKDAIDEVVRKKWPVKPRELLEEGGVVKPLPKEEDGKDGKDDKAADKPAEKAEKSE